MTDTARRDIAAGRTRYDEQPTGWAGWIAFAAVMLIVLSLFHAVQGLVALFDDGFYLVRADGLVVAVDFTTWGWIHLAVGLAGVLVGLGLLTGNTAARVIGVGIAFLSALVNLTFLPAYPVWSTILIAFDVIVIYAITVHGREMSAHASR